LFTAHDDARSVISLRSAVGAEEWEPELEVVGDHKRLNHCLRDKLPLPYDDVARKPFR
jgi:hypothetical protein